MMEVIPVLDIMDGKAVAGKSGRRWEYRELETVYAVSPDPLEIAKALPHRRLYVADLDGITEGRPDYSLLEMLSGAKRLIVDVGVRDYGDYMRAKALDVEVVVATETLRGDGTLHRMVEEGCIVSIDMKDGGVLSSSLGFETPSDAFGYFRDRGADKFIFLDISAVGTLGGNRFGFLEHIDTSGAEIMVGGGIVPEDIPVLDEMGVDGVLVGTALHKGLL
ncbi:MAG: HisA/HisF-related TIM barrel protein [Candidatus Hydrothermarchaeaceae archaeon]